MSQTSKEEALNKLERSVRDMVNDMEAISKELKSFQDQVDKLERRIIGMNLPRLEYALRSAYTKASRAGSSLVEAHMALNMSPSVFQTASTSRQREAEK